MDRLGAIWINRQGPIILYIKCIYLLFDPTLLPLKVQFISLLKSLYPHGIITGFYQWEIFFDMNTVCLLNKCNKLRSLVCKFDE